MKKIFYIFTAALVALSITVGVCAEDIHVETTDDVVADTVDAAETADVTDEVTAEESTEDDTVETATDTEETITEVESDTDDAPDIHDDMNELMELLGASTPEQVELVRQYLLYGLNTLPLSEKTKIAVLEHINTVAWILVGISFIVMGILYVRSNKKSGDENRTMTENAIAMYNKGTDRSEAAAARMEEAETQIANITKAAFTAIKEAEQTADKTLHDTANTLINMVNRSNADAAKVIGEAAAKETALTDAVLTMCDLFVRLINDSDIPEADRDAYTRIYNKALERIKEVTGDDRKED